MKGDEQTARENSIVINIKAGDVLEQEDCFKRIIYCHLPIHTIRCPGEMFCNVFDVRKQ